MAKVAGFDKAVYGLDGTTAHPILFVHPTNSNLLVSTTKLSQFITARYSPKTDWQAIWKMILAWLTSGEKIVTLDWNMSVRPTYGKNDVLPSDAQRKAILRGIDWHTNAKMLIHSSWKDDYDRLGGVSHPLGSRPDPGFPVGANGR